jgi:hypothetical protein
MDTVAIHGGLSLVPGARRVLLIVLLVPSLATAGPARHVAVIRGPDVRPADRGSARYQAVEGRLIDGRPQRDDVLQGGDGDCGLDAGMSGMAAKHPNVIRKMFTPGPDGTRKVRLWHRPKWNQPVKAVQVPIDDRLPVKDGDTVYNRVGPNQALWPALLEKAYARRQGGYQGLMGISPMLVLRSMGGGEPERIHVRTTDPAVLFAKLKAAVKDKYVIIAGTYGEKHGVSFAHTRILPAHGYTVLDAKTRGGEPSVLLRNPWGEKVPGRVRKDNGEFWLRLSDFGRYYLSVTLAPVPRDPAALSAPVIAARPHTTEFSASALQAEQEFLTFVAQAAKGGRVSSRDVLAHYQAVRQAQGPGPAIVAALEDLPEKKQTGNAPPRKGLFTTSQAVPSVAGLVRSGLITADEVPQILLSLGSKAFFGGKAFVRDLLAPAGSGLKHEVGAAVERVLKENGTMADAVLAAARQTRGKAEIDLTTLRAAGLIRAADEAPLRTQLRALGYQLPDAT